MLSSAVMTNDFAQSAYEMFKTMATQHFVEYLKTQGVEEFLKEKGKGKHEALEELIASASAITVGAKRAPAGARTGKAGESLTIDTCKDLASDEYDDNWHDDDNHCAFFSQTRITETNPRMYTHCGKPGGLICTKHGDTKQGKDIIESNNKGEYDREKYHKECIDKRKKFAAKKEKEIGGSSGSSLSAEATPKGRVVGKAVQYALDKTLLYIEGTGILIKSNNQSIAVGIAPAHDKPMQKFSTKDLEYLTKINLTAEPESMTEDARRHIESYRQNQSAVKATLLRRGRPQPSAQQPAPEQKTPTATTTLNSRRAANSRTVPADNKKPENVDSKEENDTNGVKDDNTKDNTVDDVEENKETEDNQNEENNDSVIDMPEVETPKPEPVPVANGSSRRAPPRVSANAPAPKFPNSQQRRSIQPTARPSLPDNAENEETVN